MQIKDGGLYTCEARNIVGMDSNTIVIEVTELPRIISSTDNLKFEQYQYAQIPCVVTGSPDPVVTWKKDG